MSKGQKQWRREKRKKVTVMKRRVESADARERNWRTALAAHSSTCQRWKGERGSIRIDCADLTATSSVWSVVRRSGVECNDLLFNDG